MATPKLGSNINLTPLQHVRLFVYLSESLMCRNQPRETPATRKPFKLTSAFLFDVVGSHAIFTATNAPARLHVGIIQCSTGNHLPLPCIFQTSAAGGTVISTPKVSLFRPSLSNRPLRVGSRRDPGSLLSPVYRTSPPDLLSRVL